MNTNDANVTDKLIYRKLSYLITGLCFDIHNELGRFSKEKQYCDLLEEKLKLAKIVYKREYKINDTGNIIDFLIEDKILLEIKAKRLILKIDFYQTQRYLQSLGIKLGMILNFRNRYLKPIRIIKIDTDARNKYK